MSRSMKHCCDYNHFVRLNHFEHNSVGESFQVTPANVFPFITTAMKKRIYSEFVQYGQEFFDKSVTKAFAAAVIPFSDLDNINLCFRS